jgi:hypothetical protein
MEAAFLTLFLPAGIILAINVILFLRICCLLRFSTSRQTSVSHCDEPDTEETQDNNEIEVLAPRRTPSTVGPSGARSIRSDSISSDHASSILDPAYKPSRQLYAIVALLALFSTTWVAGACVMSPPVVFAYSDVVYQCLYAAAAASFGLFVIVYYCLGRPEVRTLSCSSCRHRRRKNKTSDRVVEANSSGPRPSANGSVTCGDDVSQMEHVVVVHNTHLAGSSAASVAERASLAAKSACSDGEPSLKLPASCAMQSSMAAASLVPPPPPAAPAAVAAVPDYAMFYNPRQNGVARKYWERAKKRRAAGQLCHKPAGALQDVDGGGEMPVNGGLRSNCEVLQRRPLLERDDADIGRVVTIENGISDPHHHVAGEQQPLLPILAPLCKEPNGAVSTGYGVGRTSSPVLTPNGYVDLDCSSSSLDGIAAVQSQQQQHSIKPPSVSNGRMTEVMNGFASCGGGVKAAARGGEKKGESFIEQLELRIPSCKQTKMSSPGDGHVESTEVIKNDTLAGRKPAVNGIKGHVKREPDARSPIIGSPSAFAFMNKNYSSTLPSMDRTVRPDNNLDGNLPRDATSSTLLESATRPSSPCDIGSSDIWVMQNAKSVKAKTETSV